MKYKAYWISAAVILITAALYYHQKDIAMQYTLNKIQEDLVIATHKIVNQTEAIQINIADSTIVYDTNKQAHILPSIAKKHDAIVLYIDRYQCDICWKGHLDFLLRMKKMFSEFPPIVILAANYNLREAKLLHRRIGQPVALYLTQGIPEIQYLENFRKPFFFILSSNSPQVSSVYFPDDHSSIGDSIYFDTVVKKTTQKKVANASIEKLELLPEDTLMPDFKLRKKYSITFKIKNHGESIAEITHVDLSCSCLSLKGYTKVIKPGETGLIEVTFLATERGPYERIVEFTTEKGEEPYYFFISGKVV